MLLFCVINLMATLLNIIVLAAGEGTRMQSALPKVLHQVGGRSMLGHVLAVADALGAARTVVVCAADTLAPISATFGPHYEYVVQAERLGTGHAVMAAHDLLADAPGDVLVLYADSPLIQVATAQALVEGMHQNNASVGLLSFHAEPLVGYGRVMRDADGQVLALVEERNATPAQLAISEGNSGFMAFDGAWLWSRIGDIPRNPVKGEYYLTDLVAMAVEQRGPGAVVAVAAADPRDAWGANDRTQLAEAERVLRERTLAALMRAGVTVTDPATTYVDVTATVGRDSILLPGTMLRGATIVGVDCQIGPYTTIIDSHIGDGARITYALIEGNTVAAGKMVGPFVHVHGDAQQ